MATNKPKTVKKLNKTNKSNSASITKAINQYTKKYKKMPSLAEISDTTGLTRQTISRHLKDLRLPDYLDKYKELTDDVMECLLNSCKSGNVHAIKLYFQMVWRWKPPKIDEAVPSENKTNFIILTGNEAAEHNRKLEKSTSESIPLNRKIQQQKDDETSSNSENRGSDEPHPLLKDWGTI